MIVIYKKIKMKLKLTKMKYMIFKIKMRSTNKKLIILKIKFFL